MICAERIAPGVDRASRRIIAGQRALAARVALTHCDFCAHLCGADRLAGERGPCHAGPVGRFFSYQIGIADELELVPTFAVAMSGCDLRCDFCITGEQSWNPAAGSVVPAGEMATRAECALAGGARTVMLLGGEPTIHLPEALEFVAALPVTAKLVWKTNGHGSARCRELLDGIFDVWLADLKFGNDSCALRLAKVSNYLQVVRENLVWARTQSELIVRHLLMPGHVDCCWRPIAEWLAGHLPGVKVSLRSGFWPAWHAARHPELRGTTTDSENRRAAAIAIDFDLNLIQ
jgi:putative pyruvate formate lyase activating enzyme